MRETKQLFSITKARLIGDALGIDWKIYRIEQFRLGLEVELEHGVRDPKMSISQEDLKNIAKIVWAHMNDNPDFYTRFEKI